MFLSKLRDHFSFLLFQILLLAQYTCFNPALRIARGEGLTTVPPKRYDARRRVYRTFTVRRSPEFYRRIFCHSLSLSLCLVFSLAYRQVSSSTPKSANDIGRNTQRLSLETNARRFELAFAFKMFRQIDV